MWSDRTRPEELRALAAKLHSVAPAAGAHPADSGFTYLSGRLFENPMATVTYADGFATARGPGGTVEIGGRAFDILEAMLEAWRGHEGALLAGFLSYDLAAELEDVGLAPRQFNFPQFHFSLYQPPGPAPDFQAATTASGRVLRSTPDRQGFEASVERIVSSIHAGDIFQTNLCRCIEACIEPGSEWDLFQRMRSISPARYEAFLRLDAQRAVMSVSPELFLKVEGGMVESSPIKGTRPRSCNAEEDRALAAELLSSEKDRAELAMIVDVTRNDLSRVCQAGSVRVVKHAELMTLPTVHHTVSTVGGRLRPGAGPVDLLRAAFPAASITGAPKIEAMRAAMREEGQPRGPCMGAIGWISMDGRMELSVAIRTAFAANGHVRYYAGCGITADSVPSTEFEESEHKAAAFLRAVGQAVLPPAN